MGFGYGSGFDDILSAFFRAGVGRGGIGGGGGRTRRGGDLSLHLQMSLDEVANDVTKEIEIPRIELCSVCRGSGAAPGTTPKKCPQCGGTGQLQRIQNAGLA